MAEPANTEIKYSVDWEIVGEDKYPKLRVIASTRALQYYKDAEDFFIHDTVYPNRNLSAILDGSLDNHECPEGETICTKTGLWTIRNDMPELAEAHWFVIVNLVKLTHETGEPQQFTLDIGELKHV